MFLHLSVILFTGGGLPQCMLGYHPPPPRGPGTPTPPPQRRAYWEIRSTSGWCASYWSAILFFNQSMLTSTCFFCFCIYMYMSRFLMTKKFTVKTKKHSSPTTISFLILFKMYLHFYALIIAEPKYWDKFP